MPKICVAWEFKHTSYFPLDFCSQLNVRCGMAQGSILGPLIYILYETDLLRLLENEKGLYLYADDMLLLLSNKNVENMILSLQNKMNRICDWCISKKLTINQAKAKYMIVLNVTIDPISKIYISGRELGQVSHYEYLGMIIAGKLNMDKQIDFFFFFLVDFIW